MGLERVWSGFAGGGSGFRVSSEWVDSGFRAEMCCGNEAGSYLRLTDSCITQLEAHGPSRTCNESKDEEEVSLSLSLLNHSPEPGNHLAPPPHRSPDPSGV